jgi:hypothetical protein
VYCLARFTLNAKAPFDLVNRLFAKKRSTAGYLPRFKHRAKGIRHLRSDHDHGSNGSQGRKFALGKDRYVDPDSK